MRLLALFSLVLLATQPALAYIEPGSGGMMVQLAVAGAVGCWVWIRIYWRRFLALFNRKPAAVKPAEDGSKGTGQ